MKKQPVSWHTVVVAGSVTLMVGIVIGIELLEKMGAWIAARLLGLDLAPSNS